MTDPVKLEGDLLFRSGLLQLNARPWCVRAQVEFALAHTMIVKSVFHSAVLRNVRPEITDFRLY